MVAVALVDIAAVVVGAGELRVEFYGLGVIRNCALEVAVRAVQKASTVVGVGELLHRGTLSARIFQASREDRACQNGRRSSSPPIRRGV